MPDFLNHFPSEIVTKIISHVSQVDCIECLRVCKQWHLKIPSHSQQLWRQLEIIRALETRTNISWGEKTNDCLIKCLPFVNKVTIKGFIPGSIIRTLADLSCAITFLEINEEIDYDGDISTEHLIEAISPFRNTLTELIITDYSRDISLTQLIKSLPELTHFTFQFGHYAESRHYMDSGYLLEDDIDSYRGFSSKLVYLHMEVSSNFEQTFDLVLSICPNLRALVVPNEYDLGDNSECDLLDPRLSLLRFLLWNESVMDTSRAHKEALDRWKIASTDSAYDEEVGILHEVIYIGDMEDTEGNDTIVPLLERSQQHMTYVHFSTKCMKRSVQSLEIALLQFPQLKSLVLTVPDDAEYEWADFISECEQLESLDLKTVYEDSQLRNIIESISMPKVLRSLRLRTIYGRNPLTQNISITGMIRDKFPTLQHLSLSGICISDEDLLDNICDIQTLRALELDMDRYETDITLEGLLKAADSLRVKDSNIQSLELTRVSNLTDAVLERLGHVKNISKVFICINSEITEKGVLAFLDVPHSGTRSLSVSMCPKTAYGKEWHR